MARRTKEEIRKERNEKRLDELVQTNKFLREEKYYKNNYWGHAAWDSWAAQGKNGSCGCGCGYYNAALRNNRRETMRGGRHESCQYVIEKICSACLNGIEKRLGVNFKSKY